jgi:hypothetical protein
MSRREPESAANRSAYFLARSGGSALPLAAPPPEPPPTRPKPPRRIPRIRVESAGKARQPEPPPEPPPPHPLPPVAELLRDDRGREAVRIGNRVYRPHWQDLDPDQLTRF